SSSTPPRCCASSGPTTGPRPSPWPPSAGSYEQSEREDALAGQPLVEPPERLLGLVEPELVADQPLQRHLPLDDEARALREADRAERARAVDGQLLVDDVAADVEGGRPAEPAEADPPPPPRPAHPLR